MLRKWVLLILPLLLCSCEKKAEEISVIYDDYGNPYTKEMLDEAFYHKNVSMMSYGYQIDCRPKQEIFDEDEKLEFEIYVGNNNRIQPSDSYKASLVYSIRSDSVIGGDLGYRQFPIVIKDLEDFFDEGKYQVNHSYISDKNLAFDYYSYHTSVELDFQPYRPEIEGRIFRIDFGISISPVGDHSHSGKTYYLASLGILNYDNKGGKIQVL